MSIDGSIKVESSFPSRNKRTVSEEKAHHPLNRGIAQSESEDSEDDVSPDPDNFLSSNIIYQNPYSDEDVKQNNIFDLGPQSEQNYIFGNSQSIMDASDLENTTAFHSSNWAEFPEWSLHPLQQQAGKKSPYSQQNPPMNQYDISQSTASWMKLPAPSMILNEDDPLIFLKSQESKILSSLNVLLLRHSEFLGKGHGKVKKIRYVILNHLNQLHEVHQSMNEIYNSEKSNRLHLLQRFQEWETKKNLLLTKINEIQSDSNEEGARFTQLVKQSNEIDASIDDLEIKLKQMKQKRAVIRKELESSQSVIESKSSSYIESLDVIESNERNVIERLSNFNFKNSIPIPDLVLPKNVSAPSTGKTVEDNNESMSILDLSKLNISKFFTKSNNKNDAKITNLITEKYTSAVDVSPVVNSLKLQVDAINDELEKQENLSYKFQESGIIWNESIGNVLQMENSFKSNTNISEAFILKTLQDTLDILTQRLEVASDLQLSIVKNAVINEISTIRKALYIITSDETYLEKNNNITSVESGVNTPSSLSSSSDKKTPVINNNISKSSSNSSFAKGAPAVSSPMGLKISTNNNNNNNNTDANPLYMLNTASPPAPTLASSGPPTILSSKAPYAESGKRKSSIFNLGFNSEKASEKIFKKD